MHLAILIPISTRATTRSGTRIWQPESHDAAGLDHIDASCSCPVWTLSWPKLLVVGWREIS
jgi:hypothetical protein